MSTVILGRAGLLFGAAAPGLKVPPASLLRSRVLDGGMIVGAVAAMADPNWVGISGVVVAAGSILVKLRELDVKSLRAQNGLQADQIAWLTRELGAIRGPAEPPKPAA